MCLKRVLVVCVGGLLSMMSWAQDPPAAPKVEAKPEGQATEKAPELPARLAVGDKAPALAIEKWVKGEPMKGFEKDKVYVVEFWATWCPPCIKSFPHLTELQKKHKDKGVTIIGVTSEDDRGNTLDAVSKLVEKNGDENMGYTVAWDKGRETSRSYMEAARQGGIPCAFVVDKEGTLAWVGHPAEMDEPLEQIVAGKFDRKGFAEKFNKQQAKMEEQVKLERELEPLEDLVQDRKIDEATKLIDSQFTKFPMFAEELAMAKFQILLMAGREPEKAFAWAKEAAETHLSKSAEALSQIAWAILEGDMMPKKDFELALSLAEKASKLEPEEPSVLDTLAKAYFAKNDLAKAVETQKKAVELAKKKKADDEAIEEFSERLKEYEKAAAEKK